jgi:hypothetical protein
MEAHLQSSRNTLSQQQIHQHSQQIINACTKARFQYELQRLEAASSKQYDEYISIVFEIVLQERLTNDMQ